MLFNKKPRALQQGGNVTRHPKMTRAQLRNDSVRAILMPGEIVIPVKYAKTVNAFLKSRRIHLPMKQ